MGQVKNIHSIKENILIFGRVVHGRKQGRELGFPTANIAADAEQLENGVYGVQVSLKGKLFWGIMNVGVKPTYGSDLKKTIEVHLLDFYSEIYGELLRCQILFKVREEHKFSSIEFLKQQIMEDINYANKHFKFLEDSYKTTEIDIHRTEQIS